MTKIEIQKSGELRFKAKKKNKLTFYFVLTNVFNFLGLRLRVVTHSYQPFLDFLS
jgi:hypothetical protein